MERAPNIPPRELPAIVLIVDEQREALARYSQCLEDAGLWVAASTMPTEVVAAAEELNPDVIVADTDAQPDVFNGVIDALKRHASLGGVPIIVLTSAATGPQRADSVLVKPVSPRALLSRTNELLSRVREAQTRSLVALERAERAVERAKTTVEHSTRLAAVAETRRRPCPDCGGLLDWVEHAAVGGVRYDYYRWCLKGCGLYCFDRDHEKWVRLA